MHCVCGHIDRNSLWVNNYVIYIKYNFVLSSKISSTGKGGTPRHHHKALSRRCLQRYHIKPAHATKRIITSPVIAPKDAQASAASPEILLKRTSSTINNHPSKCSSEFFLLHSVLNNLTVLARVGTLMCSTQLYAI